MFVYQPRLHQRAALLAMEARVSLNAFVTESIRSRVSSRNKRKTNFYGCDRVQYGYIQK